ncbi:MAG: hypothetical protein PUC65_12960 [Clostridiales bacterium]|nr:hypothetical protein [Clostridiales bacterium]
MNKFSFLLLGLLIIISLSSCSEFDPKSWYDFITSSSNNEETSITINTPQGDETITIVKENSSIILQEDVTRELVKVMEESLDNNPGMTNLWLSAEDIENFKRDGLSISVEYKDEKELAIGLPEFKLKVSQIRVLIDKNHHYIEYASKGSIEVFVLTKDSYDMILTYFE